MKPSATPKPAPLTELGHKLLAFMVDHHGWAASSFAYHFHCSEYDVLVELRKLMADGRVSSRKVRIGNSYVYDLTDPSRAA